MGIFDIGNEHVNKSNVIREHKFPDTLEGMKRARLLQKNMHHHYGFKPNILRVTHPRTGKSFLVIAQHKEMKKIR